MRAALVILTALAGRQGCPFLPVTATAQHDRLHEPGGDQYVVGTGRADITGPAADVNMMGYAMIDQIAAGIHTRQYARTYIFDDGSKRLLFINLDTCMASQGLYIRLLERLAEQYGDTYTKENVMMSGIHTHAGPAGYLQVRLPVSAHLGQAETGRSRSVKAQ